MEKFLDACICKNKLHINGSSFNAIVYFFLMNLTTRFTKFNYCKAACAFFVAPLYPLRAVTPASPGGVQPALTYPSPPE